MEIITAPNKTPKDKMHDFSVFLAGSIEMGVANAWQEKLISLLKLKNADARINIYNPRRTDWDSSWEQSRSNPAFYEQVSWELSKIEAADVCVVVFDPETKSPITLLELGLIAGLKHAVVLCPAGFWRKGNVDIVCERYGTPMVDSLDEVADWLCARYKSFIMKEIPICK